MVLRQIAVDLPRERERRVEKNDGWTCLYQSGGRTDDAGVTRFVYGRDVLWLGGMHQSMPVLAGMDWAGQWLASEDAAAQLSP